MATPQGFSWVEKSRLAAMAAPRSLADLAWLRAQGVQVLLSLTEERPRRTWSDEAGLLVFHEPLEDMEPPRQDALHRAVSAINRAMDSGLPVAVHCGAGLGRTGVVLAAWMVSRGLGARQAITRVRKLRPNSVETDEQEEAVEEFARLRISRAGESGTASASGTVPPPAPSSPS